MIRSFLLSIGLLGCATAAWGQDASERIAPEETKAVDNRRAIKQLHAEYVAEYTKGPNARRFRRDFWLDGDKLREDVVRPIDMHGTVGERENREFMIVTPEIQCAWSMVGGERNNVAISYRKMKEGALGFSGPGALDPRLFGFSPYSSGKLRLAELDSVLLTADRTSFSAKNVEFQDRPGRELLFERQNGVRYRVVLRDQGGWQPAFIEVTAKRGGQDLQCQVTVLDFSEPKPGRFFPKGIHYVRREKGQVVEEEKGTFKVISIDEPIDPVVFTLKGMGVPKGQAVSMMPAGVGLFMWDGEAIVRNRAAEGANKSNQGANTFPNGYDIGTIAFSIVAIAASFVLLRRRPQTLPSLRRLGPNPS